MTGILAELTREFIAIRIGSARITQTLLQDIDQDISPVRMSAQNPRSGLAHDWVGRLQFCDRGFGFEPMSLHLIESNQRIAPHFRRVSRLQSFGRLLRSP